MYRFTVSHLFYAFSIVKSLIISHGILYLLEIGVSRDQMQNYALRSLYIYLIYKRGRSETHCFKDFTFTFVFDA